MNAPALGAQQPVSGGWARWWPFLLVASLYGFVGSREIELPGIYMDAVNPDYMVARILGSGARSFAGWAPPGNDLLHRFPVLVGLHHGSMQFWLGLPLFAIFGMSVTGLRLVHMCFALGVLAASYWLLLRGGVRRWLAAGACIALALDPAFVFAFRTQGYITMAPFALLMLTVGALMRARDTVDRKRTAWLIVSGGMAGLACFGYFIYSFFLPCLLIAASRLPSGRNRMRNVGWLCLGIALGASPYVAGYALIAYDMKSIRGAWSHLISVEPGLGLAARNGSLAERFDHLVEMFDMVLTDSWHRTLMFREDSRSAVERWKAVALVALPLAGWLAIERMRISSWMVRVLVGLLASYVAGTLVFGTRLAGHHFMPLVPLVYVTLAASAESLLTRFGAMLVRAGVWVAGCVLLALNVAADSREIAMLQRTGGVATFSDAINRFGSDLAAGTGDDLLAFPDWGLFMPVAFLTHARYEMEPILNEAQLRRALCGGRDVVVGLIDGDRASRARALQDALRWSAPYVHPYRQRDGTIAFEAFRFGGNRNAPGCLP